MSYFKKAKYEKKILKGKITDMKDKFPWGAAGFRSAVAQLFLKKISRSEILKWGRGRG